MTAEHNHPPHCCCQPDPWNGRSEANCPACPEHGDLAQAECPSCHTHDGHPHTDYCRLENRDYPGQPAPGSYAWAKQAARNAASEATCGFRSLDNPDLTCTYPPHPVNQIHSWQNGGDPGGWRNAIDPNKP